MVRLQKAGVESVVCRLTTRWPGLNGEFGGIKHGKAAARNNFPKSVIVIRQKNALCNCFCQSVSQILIFDVRITPRFTIIVFFLSLQRSSRKLFW